MREPELVLPDIDQLDSPFKRRVALSVALIALLGSLLGNGSARAGNHEAELTRAAQQQAVEALAGQTSALAEVYDHFGRYAAVAALRERRDTAARWSQLVPDGHDAQDRDRWRLAHQQLADVTPLVQQGQTYEDRSRFHMRLSSRATLARLRQEALLETASGWGGKSDLYVLGITLLALALTLLGLSLTVRSRARRLLVRPAALLSVLVLCGSSFVVLRAPAQTPDRAIAAVAEGDGLMGVRDYAGAVAAYTRALDVRQDYATAYRERSLAHLLAGTPEGRTSQYTFGTASLDARRRAVADLDRALQHGPRDYVSLVNQGANLFHLQRYEESERFSREALALAADPLPQGNLALVLAAQGREADARRAYDVFVELLAQRPDPVERSETFRTVRATLATLARLEPERRPVAEALQGRLVGAEARLRLPGPAAPGAAEAVVEDARLAPTGTGWTLSFSHRGVPADARVSYIGYFRPRGSEDFLQPESLTILSRFGLEEPGQGVLPVDDACLGAGTYRFDLFVEERLMTTVQADTPATAVELLAEYDQLALVRACRPAGWRRIGERPGTLELRSSGAPAQTLTVSAVPLPSALRDRPGPEVLERALDTLGRQPGPSTTIGTTVARTVDGLPGQERRYALPGGRTALTWAAVGEDGLLRLVTAVQPADDAALLDGLVSRVRFYTLPA